MKRLSGSKAESKLMAKLVPVLVGSLVLLAACPEEMANENAGKRPSEALTYTVAAAKEGDVERFKQGLSANFIATIERYQQLGAAKEELKGAFEWPVFMRSLAMTDPAPKEELIKGNKAKVRAIHKDGTDGMTEMILEDGAWKLEVPGGMVTGLDHFDDIAKMAAGEAVDPKAEVPTGGGGKADRVKNLPADAPANEQLKAAALDAFDLGDLGGAVKKLEEALTQNAGDEEITVALGRAYVQTAKGEDAVELFEAHLAKDDAAVPVRHYLGMAYMLANEPKKAAAEWQKVMELDAAYGSKFRLDQRAAAALAIAEGGGAAPQHGDVGKAQPGAPSMHGAAPTHGAPAAPMHGSATPPGAPAP